MAAEIASLSFSVDSSQLDKGTSSLNRMEQASTGVVTKVGQLQSSVSALVAALDRNTASANALTAKLDSVQLSAAKTSVSVKGVGDAANDAMPKVDKLGTATDRLKPAFDNAAASAAKLRAAWAELGTQGGAVLRNMEMMAKLAESSANKPNPGWSKLGPMGAAQSYAVTPVGRLSNLSSDGGVYGAPRQTAGPANQNRPGGGRLDANGLQNLFYQGTDIIASAASGISPMTIALQQGGQIAPTFMGKNGATAGGILGQAGDAVTGFVARLNPMVVALGLAGTAAAAAAYALSSYSSQQKELQLSVAGRGRASGATVGDINRVASAGAVGAGVSVSGARDMVADYADTGRIGTAMYGGLLKAAQDYAVTTRQDLPEANKVLAASFADIGKGVDTINGQLNAYSAAQVETIKRMDASGDRAGAQAMALDILGKSLLSANERLGIFARGWVNLKGGVSDAIDLLGSGLDRVISGGGDLETQIATAQKVLQNSQGRASYLPFGIGDADVAKAQSAYDALIAKQKALQDGNKSADLNQRSGVVDRLVKAANPANENLKQLEDNAKRIRTELAAGVLDPSGESLRTAQGLEASAKRIREDLAAGGSEFAAGLRRAQFDSSQVGRSSTSVSGATIDFEAEERKKAVIANTSNIEQRMDALRTIEAERMTRQEALQKQSVISSSSGSGSYARGLGQAPEQYRDAYYNAAQKFGINPDLLVSQGYQESRFNPNAVSSAGAQGISQFMPGTARGIGLSNPFDPAQAIPKQAELMRQLLDRYNNNETAALVGYNAGPKVGDRFVKSGFDTSVLPKETQDYIAKIQTAAPNAGARVTETVERNRQLDLEGAKLKANSEYLGENGLKLDTQTRYQELLAQAVSKNIEITDGYKQQLMATAEATAGAARSLTNLKAAADLRFDDQQMGRDRYDQQAYSSARGLYGDTSTQEAQNYIGQKRDQLQMQDVKSTLQDTSTGFVQALSKGATAASAFGNALSKLGDKLISNAMDSLFSSAFGKGGVGGAGSGFGGLLGGLFGGGGSSLANAPLAGAQGPTLSSGGGGLLGAIGGLFGFANGGVMTNQGPVQLRRYASGGVANSPQLALYGEAGVPEAYVPLPDGRRIPVAISGPANGNQPAPQQGGGMSRPVFMINAPGSTMSKEEYIGLTTQVIERANAENRRTQYSRAVVDKKAYG